jgi:hypothetical protein
VSFDAAKEDPAGPQNLEYGGSCLSTTAMLSGTCIPIVVDVVFGDAIEPGTEDIDLPALFFNTVGPPSFDENLPSASVS